MNINFYLSSTININFDDLKYVKKIKIFFNVLNMLTKFKLCGGTMYDMMSWS